MNSLLNSYLWRDILDSDAIAAEEISNLAENIYLIGYDRAIKHFKDKVGREITDDELRAATKSIYDVATSSTCKKYKNMI